MMANWYCSREAVKRAIGIQGVDHDPMIDRIIEGVSRQIDHITRRFFIPKTETRLYRWPPEQSTRADYLWLDQDLLAVTTLRSEAQNSSPTTIASTDYFLEPNNVLPYNRIEIDASSTASFQAGDTPQRSISVLGRWGYSEDTRSAGTVISGLSSDATATSMVCSDSELINVGDTLLIESEQLFVSDRSFAALDSILTNGTLTANQAENITVDGSHGIAARETIRINDEEMFVTGVSGNNLTVIRAYNGTTLAAHSDDQNVHINRTLTVERGINGTTSATHANSTTISVYEPPFEVTNYAIAESVARYSQERSGWGRVSGAGESQREFVANALTREGESLLARYRRVRMAVI
jgi:hypothetical protein